MAKKWEEDKRRHAMERAARIAEHAIASAPVEGSTKQTSKGKGKGKKKR